MTPTAPGRYLYADPIGSPPEPVEVQLDGEVLMACFRCDEEAPELVPIADMAGDFRPA